MITEIELLSYPSLSPEEEARVQAFLGRVNVIDLTPEVKGAAIRLRKGGRLKLPDAIIAGTATVLDAVLLTNDAALANVPGLKCVVPKLS